LKLGLPPDKIDSLDADLKLMVLRIVAQNALRV
jgi:hypothetical protein